MLFINLVESVKHCKFWWQVWIQHQDMDEQRVKCIQTFMRKSAQTEQVNCFPPYDWLTHISCNNIGIWNITHLSWIQCQKFSPGRASNHSPVSWGRPALHGLYGWKRGGKLSSNSEFAKAFFFTPIYYYCIWVSFCRTRILVVSRHKKFQGQMKRCLGGTTPNQPGSIEKKTNVSHQVWSHKGSALL